MTSIPASVVADRQRRAEQRAKERAEAERIAALIAEKTREKREAEAEERRRRAEAHRLAALPGLADRLAGAVFDEIERSGRVLVRAQLADALLAVLMRSGLAQDPRRPPS